MKRWARMGMLLAMLGGCSTVHRQPAKESCTSCSSTPASTSAPTVSAVDKAADKQPLAKNADGGSTPPVYVLLEVPNAGKPGSQELKPVVTSPPAGSSVVLGTLGPAKSPADREPARPISSYSGVSTSLKGFSPPPETSAPLPTLPTTSMPLLPPAAAEAKSSAPTASPWSTQITAVKPVTIPRPEPSAPTTQVPTLPEPSALTSRPSSPFTLPAAPEVHKPAAAPPSPALASAADQHLNEIPAPEVRGPAAKPATPALGQVSYINSRRIRLNYQVPAGSTSTAAELWYTRDGENWLRHASTSPSPPYVAEMPEDGLYGLTLVTPGSASSKPPRPGDQPQAWVELDTSKPVVRLTTVEVGRAAEGKVLTVAWKAVDKNLGPTPITLLYSFQDDGPWVPMASHIENTGRYVWLLPKEAPRHVFVRVEAVDQAGNLGSATAPAGTRSEDSSGSALPTITAIEPRAE